MGPHIAFIGTGRVGRPTAYTILLEGLADELTLCDTKPELAKAFAEELKHSAASLDSDVQINWCDKDSQVQDADIVMVCAGMPRPPGVSMSRRDLAAKNCQIIRQVAEQAFLNNARATYILVTNPVDAMAAAFAKFTGCGRVMGTGTTLETVRFRSRLASMLGVAVSTVKGYVGGEHGDSAAVLWSTVTVGGMPVERYASSKGIALDKPEVESYVKGITRLIIDNIGATEFGPASAFKDIVRAVAKDTGEVLPVSTPMRFEGISEPAYVSVPLHLGKQVGPTLFSQLTGQEQARIQEAAKAIRSTLQTALDAS